MEKEHRKGKDGYFMMDNVIDRIEEECSKTGTRKCIDVVCNMIGVFRAIRDAEPSMEYSVEDVCRLLDSVYEIVFDDTLKETEDKND